MEKNFIKDLTIIKNMLVDILELAPQEEKCTKDENEIFSNMQNLLESIENYFIKF